LCLLDPTKTLKLRVEFARPKNQPESELWKLREIPVPSAGTGRGYQTNLSGARIMLSLSPTSIMGSVRDRTNDLRLTLVKAVDDQGRDVVKRAGSSPYAFQFNLNIPSDAKTL